ncbi:MAG: response regulator [Bryobacterales bacterium]|nr:response regulator [Bryobacterales bacterium]
MSCRVLIADDDPLSRELLCDCLEPLGVDVVQARDGVEAMEALKRSVPQLLLVDIQMPRMDGFELLRQVRANPATASIPVLAISAFAMAGDAERALARGFDHYVTKPVALGELRRLVRVFLAKQREA